MKLQWWICSCCYYCLLVRPCYSDTLLNVLLLLLLLLLHSHCCCCLYRSSFCRACRLLAPNMLLHTASTQPPPPHLHIITLADWVHITLADPENITSTDLFTCRLSYLQNNSTFTAAHHNINIIFRTTATCAHYHTYTIVHLNITADIIFEGFVLLHAWKIASQVFLDEVHDIQERKIAWDQKSRWKGNKRLLKIGTE